MHPLILVILVTIVGLLIGRLTNKYYLSLILVETVAGIVVTVYYWDITMLSPAHNIFFLFSAYHLGAGWDEVRSLIRSM